MLRNFPSQTMDLVPKEPLTFGRFCWTVLTSTVFFIYAALMPVVILSSVSWGVFFLTRTTFFSEPWMVPLLVVMGTFLSGVILRMNMEDTQSTLRMFLLSVLGFMGFACLTWMDVDSGGAVFSEYLPKFLTLDVEALTYAIPGVGIAGMLCFKLFSLKHYE